MSGYFYWLLDTVVIALIGVALAILAYRKAARVYEHGIQRLELTAARLEVEVGRSREVEISLRERVSALEGRSRP